ncbi:tetratricopeptide repeat-containing sensor histidine kinase [Algoriphagus litoralis]|uniref:tetratricopeptide repeat-containing sensor histidine kinase n=1 Tax=Algoriphagus litoralis TaxID=2202829 RepID=UPI000DB990FD|nr:tetratricopeptide repeat protein [Algoriphagus litoralis]
MKTRLFAILIILFFSKISEGFAQSPRYIIDSLKVQLKNAKTQEDQVAYYSELTWYWAMVNLDSAVEYGQRSLALAQKVNDKKAIGQAHSDLGNALMQKGNFAESKDQYLQAISIRNSIGDSAGIAGAKSNLGSVYQRLFQLDSAMSNYLYALEYFEKSGNDRYTNFVKNNLAVLHEDMRNYPKALEIYSEVAAYREQNQMIPELAMVYNNMGNIHKNTKEYQKSEDFFKKALENGQKAGDSLVLSVTYNNLATLYNAMNRPDEAIATATIGIRIAEKVNSIFDQATMEYCLANAYSKKKEYPRSKELYLKSIATMKQLEAKEEVASMYLRIIPVYAALNLPDSAQYYTDLYVEYRNSLTEDQIEELTAELQTKYETEKKDREIAQQQLTLRSKNIQLYGSLILAIALGIVGYLLYSQQKLKNRQLQQENDLKSALAQIETQNKLQEQRMLISRDLHDNIGAQLTFIISAIENLKYFEPIKEQLTQRYDTIANFTKQTITELRDTIWAMNSGEVTWEDLSGRIRDYIQKAGASASQISFDFEINDRIDQKATLASSSSIQILRVVQEAVQNAIKYSGADRLEIKIDSTGKEILVNIQDNGKGFVESEIKPGNGLYNMRKRAEELGGSLEIQSVEGSGTSILLIWPVG